MRIEIRGRRMNLTEALREHVDRRLRFALGRFASRVRRVVVRLEDLNGPKGGVHMECRIAVKADGGLQALVADRHADLYAAIDRAADRMNRLVARQMERVRSLGRLS
jgi:ribosomal subunit interface protein